MDVIYFLILFPLLVSLLLWVIPGGRGRRAVVTIAVLLISAGTIWLLGMWGAAGTVFFGLPFEPADLVIVAAELVIAVYIIWLGVRYRRPSAILLALTQMGLMIGYELLYAGGMHPEAILFLDQFSIIMGLIIGIIGGLICVYALGYMDTYHELHPGVRDRRRFFFSVMFLFLAAMFGLVFSNLLTWIFFFWEITTLCSFWLIGYSESEEATNNAFLALVLNLIGGVAFAATFVYLGWTGAPLELSALLQTGGAVALVPAVLISFAGLTKAAQMPFSSWLVGAMVAPTPVSALLHSSTMVKAGVYIIVRFAPVLTGTLAGFSISAVGATTFLVASAIALSKSNAKTVLAYSTIANLGLIVACAGVGTYKLVWAAILLIVFHAIAKSLLFLCVGTAEHRIGSRDLEDMEGLFSRMPRVTVMMFVGIAGMFLAPFGMLISKWAAIEAFIIAPFGLFFVLVLAYGGALTAFFYTKWMGKILSADPDAENVEKTVSMEKWVVLSLLSLLTIGICLLFPLLSAVLIEPFVFAEYGEAFRLSQDNIIIMLIMLALVLIVPLWALRSGKGLKHARPYLSGRARTAERTYMGSMGIAREVTTRNYYFERLFGEERLLPVASVICSAFALVSLAIAAGVIFQ